jgi:hypothetical protein
MPACTARILLGRNRREVDKECQKFNFRRNKPKPHNRLRGWQESQRKHSRIGGSHDDRRKMDAAILNMYDKQKITRRCSRSQKNCMTI